MCVKLKFYFLVFLFLHTSLPFKLCNKNEFLQNIIWVHCPINCVDSSSNSFISGSIFKRRTNLYYYSNYKVCATWHGYTPTSLENSILLVPLYLYRVSIVLHAWLYFYKCSYNSSGSTTTRALDKHVLWKCFGVFCGTNRIFREDASEAPILGLQKP